MGGSPVACADCCAAVSSMASSPATAAGDAVVAPAVPFCKFSVAAWGVVASNARSVGAAGDATCVAADAEGWTAGGAGRTPVAETASVAVRVAAACVTAAVAAAIGVAEAFCGVAVACAAAGVSATVATVSVAWARAGVVLAGCTVSTGSVAVAGISV